LRRRSGSGDYLARFQMPEKIRVGYFCEIEDKNDAQKKHKQNSPDIEFFPHIRNDNLIELS